MLHYLRIGLVSLLCGTAYAQTPQLAATSYISGLVKPIYITNCNDDRLFVVEQDGRIRIIQNDTLLLNPFMDINPQVLSTGNEQGLLGLAFHPDFKTNGYFYVNYINNNGNTNISRFSVDPLDSNHALSGSELILMTIPQPYSNHNGGDLRFGPDGYLYIPLGDGGSANDPQNRAQNPLERLGKSLRIEINHGNLYAIPPDNAYVNNANYLPEIWATGLRNPWKTCFDQFNGDFWIGDVGQNLWEEINHQSALSAGAENYGWRCYEASVPFNTTGCQPLNAFTLPVYEYSHTGGNCSVTGGEVYRGGKYTNLFGSYIFTDFCVPSFRLLKKTGTQYSYSTANSWPNAGISCFGQDWKGELYVANLYNGEVRKLIDTSGCVPVAWLADQDSVSICGTNGILRTPFADNLSYTWYYNGAQLSNASGNELSISQGGTYIVSVTGGAGICRNADTVYVSFTGATTPAAFSGLDTNYCLQQSSAFLIGNPSGGTFSGMGINGNSFTPSLAGTGTILIQYTFTDNNGCTTKQIQETEVKNCAGLEHNNEGLIAEIFPNPASDYLTLRLTKRVGNSLQVRMLDLCGKTLLTTY